MRGTIGQLQTQLTLVRDLLARFLQFRLVLALLRLLRVYAHVERVVSPLGPAKRRALSC